MFEKLSQALMGNKNAAGPHKNKAGGIFSGIGAATLGIRRKLYKAQEGAKSAVASGVKDVERTAYKAQEGAKSAVKSAVLTGRRKAYKAQEGAKSAVKSAVLTGRRKAYKAQVAAGGVVAAGGNKASKQGKVTFTEGMASANKTAAANFKRNPDHVDKPSDFSFKTKAKVVGGLALATGGYLANKAAARMGHKNKASETSAPMRNAKTPVKAKPSQIPMRNAVKPKKAADTQIPMRNAATGPIKLRTNSSTVSPLKTAKAKTINRQPAGASMEMKGSNAPKKASVSAQAALINRAGTTSSASSTRTPGKKKK